MREYYEYYYYLRNVENHPVVTVCLMVKDGVLSRGIAICSKRDSFDRKEGRRIAHGRCMKAFGGGKTCCEIKRSEALGLMDTVATVYMNRMLSNYKSMFDVSPWNEIEKKILGYVEA